MPGPDWKYYAKQRRHWAYYEAVRRRVLQHSPGESILDVGPGGTDVVLTGDFRHRAVVNKQPMNVEYPGVRVVIGDWLDVAIEPHQVVTCCQVLEHIDDDDVKRFASKLLATATAAVVVSVPYQWPAHACQYHPQDPIDDDKLARIMGREPDASEIVTDDRHRRLIAEYQVQGQARATAMASL